MPKKYRIFASIVVTLVARDLVTRPLRNKNQLLSEAIIGLCEDSDHLVSQMEYLCHLIRENDIELDEFDRIVLPNILVTEEI